MKLGRCDQVPPRRPRERLYRIIGSAPAPGNAMNVVCAVIAGLLGGRATAALLKCCSGSTVHVHECRTAALLHTGNGNPELSNRTPAA